MRRNIVSSIISRTFRPSLLNHIRDLPPLSTLSSNHSLGRNPVDALPASPPRRAFAGHNKWSKIKRSKGAKDSARAALHTKVAKLIEVASRACGGDVKDISLQNAISKAKTAQLPRVAIDGAIRRGVSPRSSTEGDLVKIRYDGAIPFQGENGLVTTVSFIISALSDNRNRAALNVKTVLKKAGGDLKLTGSNDWIFVQQGLIIVPFPDGLVCDARDEWIENLIDVGIEHGATDVDYEDTDFESDDDDANKEAILKCEPTDITTVARAIKDAGFGISEFDIRYVTKDAPISLCEDMGEKLEHVLCKFDEDAEVMGVYHNAS